MSTTPTPAPKRTNRINLEITQYRGSKTTLCAGCGHNAISERIIDAFFEMGVDPKRVIKLSGIGCSSKSPAYFLSPSHGFNSVHGRMPSVATGAMLANKTMLAIGVSGDGDTHAEAQVGDVVCLVVPDRGVVGHAVFDTAIEEPASVVRGGDRFGAVYRLTEVAIFDAARPVPESCETRRILDTLPPATGAVLRRISRAEFDALTRTLPDDRPAASI